MADDFGTDYAHNQLLAQLSARDLALLQPNLAYVDLPLRKPLEFRNRRIEYAYFLTRGLASVIAYGAADRNVEVGMIGREGVTAIPLLMATDRSPNKTFMQGAGEGWRISASKLTDAIDESHTLRNTLLHYAHAFMVQAAYSALANGRNKMEERMARWLLMAHDRTESEDLTLTHEFLSLMLGVRRPGVTLALNLLERQGVISLRRGVITIVDRKGLEKVSKGAYGVPESEYRRLFS